MGDCYVCGKKTQLRDTKGNTPQSAITLDRYMERWRKKQKLLNEDNQNDR